MRLSGTCLALGIVGLVLALGAAPALAEPKLKSDASGRVLERKDENGLTTWYVYGPSGELIEERRSDGVVVRHEQPQSKPEKPSAGR